MDRRMPKTPYAAGLNSLVRTRLLPSLITAVAPKEKVDAKSSARKFRIRSHGRHLPVAGRASTVLLATLLPEHWDVLVGISHSGSIDVVITAILPFQSTLNIALERCRTNPSGGLPGSGRCAASDASPSVKQRNTLGSSFEHIGPWSTSPAGFRNIRSSRSGVPSDKSSMVSSRISARGGARPKRFHPASTPGGHLRRQRHDQHRDFADPQGMRRGRSTPG